MEGSSSYHKNYYKDEDKNAVIIEEEDVDAEDSVKSCEAH